MINKRTLSFLSSLLLGAFFLTTKAYSAEKPNIVFFLVDDLGQRDIGHLRQANGTTH